MLERLLEELLQELAVIRSARRFEQMLLLLYQCQSDVERVVDQLPESQTRLVPSGVLAKLRKPPHWQS